MTSDGQGRWTEGGAVAGQAEPPRWRDDPTAMNGAAQLFVRALRRPQLPTAGELGRLAGIAREVSYQPPRHARVGWRYLTASAAAAVTLGALGVAFGVWRSGREAARRPPIVVPILPVPPRAASPAHRWAPLPAQAPTASAPRTAHRIHALRARPAARNDSDSLARETALVDVARDRLSVAPSDSLSALERHRRLFAHGQLAAEREFLAVEALLAMDRPAEARRRAQLLAAVFPESSYAARAARLVSEQHGSPPGAP